MSRKRKSSIQFNSPSQNRQREPMTLSANITLSVVNGAFFPPQSGNIVNGGVTGAIADTAGWLATVAGTLNDLRALLDANVATAATVFTVYKNNVATTLTISVGIGQDSASDLTHEVAVAPGNYISIECPTTTSTGWTGGATSLQFVPS